MEIFLFVSFITGVISILSPCILPVLPIFIGFNLKNPDYEYYENLFLRATQGISYHAVETGFWYIVEFAA